MIVERVEEMLEYGLYECSWWSHCILMDRHFLCVVIRDTDACPYQVTTKSTVDELNVHVCSYWNSILPDSIQFVFDYEGRSNVVDSDVNLCSFLSLCIVNQFSFLELRLFERVPLRAPDFVREPTTSEFSLAPDPKRAKLEKLECDWMFHAAPKTSNVKGHLFLKAYNGEHKCCVGYSDGTKADPVTRELIKSLIFEKIEQNPNKKARDIVRELKSDYGLEVSYDQAHAGKELCFKELYGEDIKSYTDLRWWCEAVKKHDLGSRVDLVVEGGEFKSLFLAFDACISGLEYFRRGCLMASTGKNANNGIFPLAYGIVSSETVENWHWFLKKLESILGPRVLTFISDRHEGLIQGIRDVFPTFYHAWCYQHLKNNVRSKTNKKKGEHCAAMESFNSWIKEAKGMPIATLVNWIRLKIIEQMSTMKRKGATYKGFICTRLEKKVLASIRAGVQWRITKSGDMEWEVVDGKHTHAVNIAKFQCSCRVWFTEQFPCDHAIACMHSNNINVYEYINPYFNIASFRASYDRPIKTIPDYDKPIDVAAGDLVNPPTVAGKKHGRPKKKRIPNTGSASFKRPITCGNCHTQAHHNKTTCPHPPAKKQR
ncbi:uncharacterized protein LOC113340526 [Papaver somniferum]|uniref:uncharacterized protein LOC113340526 n=1 Tax=Papaver somniferum TaxID=3469 RepID=UPI000E6FDD0D|nr:uncharacterized protein LOC113340526 [Papaver somniferum]